MPSSVIAVLCTAPDAEVAERLARGVVEAHLAACVNILPHVRSIYRWEGRVQDDTEVLLVLKTRSDHFDDLEAWLTQHHPYDVPEVLGLPASAVSRAYLSWLEGETARD